MNVASLFVSWSYLATGVCHIVAFLKAVHPGDYTGVPPCFLFWQAVLVTL
jgi:hypothetical protein